jgi:ArsR family transcriptional regulator
MLFFKEQKMTTNQIPSTQTTTPLTRANTGMAIAGVLQPRQMPVSEAARVTPKFVPTLTGDEAVSQARLLKALSDPTRLRILSLLSRYEGDACVREIVESFPLEQPTISHHLRILRDMGLVDCRKRGLWAYYYVRREVLVRVQESIGHLLVR